MNKEEFLKEKDLLLNSIENNTKEHWENYYKGVPIECIYDDLVIDINEIKRLTEENQELKLELSGYRQAILNNKEMLGLKEKNDKLKKQLEEKNKPQIFIDTQDIEERYAEGLYQDYLEEENKKHKTQQKEFINKIKELETKLKENGINE